VVVVGERARLLRVEDLIRPRRQSIRTGVFVGKTREESQSVYASGGGLSARLRDFVALQPRQATGFELTGASGVRSSAYWTDALKQEHEQKQDMIQAPVFTWEAQT
jgi:hypothetical protein